MKRGISGGLLVAAALMAGCVSPQRGLVLDPIGPPEPLLPGTGSNGTLVVFSALDPHADFNDLPYARHYTDYKITREDGHSMQIVHNQNASPLTAPRKVPLPAGAYRVLARANGYGVVIVPVIIRAGQLTTVHLEGGLSGERRSQFGQADPVRLPDGDIAGWRAKPDGSAKP